MAANASAVRAGRAFVELFTKNNALYRGLEEGKKRVEKWAKGLQSIALKVGAVGTAITAPLAKFAADFANRGAAIHQMSERFGASAETVSRLAFAFERGGGTLEGFGGAIDGLVTKISHLENSADLFDGLLSQPLSGAELRGKSLDEVLDTIAERIKGIARADDQLRVANETGLGGLLPILKQGAAGLSAIRQEADRTGATMTGSQAQRAFDLSQAMTKAWDEFRFTLLKVGEALLPTSAATESLSEKVAEAGRLARKWVDENIGLIQSIAALGAGLIAGGVALAAFSVALKVVAVGIGLAITLLKTMAAVVFAIASPIGLATAAVVALGGHWLTSTENGKRSASALGAAFSEMGNTFSRSWSGIVTAVKAGDLKAAFEIAGLTIQNVWYRSLAAMGKAFAEFVRDNHDRIVALASLLGAFKGAQFGRFFGPWGALIGAGIGAGAGGIGADQIAGMLERLGNVGGLEAKAANAKAELDKILREQKQDERKGGTGTGTGSGDAGSNGVPAGKRYPTGEEIAAELARAAPRLYAAQKGVFGGPVAAQLGYGDQIAKRQVDAMESVAADAKVLPGMADKIGAFVAAARFK